MFDYYQMKLTFIRNILGTNPIDPNVLDTHVIEKQRGLIAANGDVNKEINKYLGNLQISDERKKEEIDLLVEKLETVIGRKFSAEEKEKAIKGELEDLKETFVELELRGTTVFLWDKKTNKPCILDHMIKGFMKAGSEAICQAAVEKKKGTVLTSASYTASLINKHVACFESVIPFSKDIRRTPDGKPSYLQRSLRAMTAQGPRTTLVKSEVIDSDPTDPCVVTFKLKVLKNSPITEKVIEKIFTYGELSGIGQWRNAGYGQFTFELTKIKDKDDDGEYRHSDVE